MPFNHTALTSWWKHPQTCRNGPWSWCAVHAPSGSSSDADRGSLYASPSRKRFLPHLLQTVQILTEIGLEVVGDHLAVLSGLNVLLSVQEPLGDIELKRSVDHSNELLNLIVRQLSGTTQ